MDIGSIIKELRKERGFSQGEFAEKCKISQTSLSQIETGATKPNKETFKRICKKLNVSEVLIYLTSLEEDDLPEKKKGSYKILYPTIKSALMQLMKDEK